MQRITRHAGAMLLATAALASCGGNESWEETWEVQASEQECHGAFDTTLCLVTRAGASSPWEYSYGIDGFHYEMGNRYQVRVRLTALSNPPIDGPDVEIELEDVLAKTAVPRSETFELSVTEPSSITKVDDTTYRLFNRRDLVCKAEDCLAIEAARSAGMGLLLEFDHQNSPTGPMHLLGIQCSAPSADFWRACMN